MRGVGSVAGGDERRRIGCGRGREASDRLWKGTRSVGSDTCTCGPGQEGGDEKRRIGCGRGFNGQA
eukprot:4875492-Pyramimonas_sp.AAC.1